MNAAGAIGYLLLQGAPITVETLTGALTDMADEPVDPRLLAGLVEATDDLWTTLRPIPLDELREQDRPGLFTVDRRVLDHALTDSTERAPAQGDRTWAKAVAVGPDALVYPQDRRPEMRVVVWAPTEDNAKAVRLDRLDLGVDALTEKREPQSVEPEPCSIQFKGWGADLKETCVPGTCPFECANNWKIRGPNMTLFGCSCLRP